MRLPAHMPCSRPSLRQELSAFVAWFKTTVECDTFQRMKPDLRAAPPIPAWFQAGADGVG
jgi:hypothetical protein